MLFRSAAKIDDSLPAPSGPSGGYDTHEHLAELLLAAKQPKEATAEFAKALARHPRRARSLLGAARAANALGDRATAAARSRELIDVWQKADPDTVGLDEAKGYLAEGSLSADPRARNN